MSSADLALEDVALLVGRLVYDGLVVRTAATAPKLGRIVSDDEDEGEEDLDGHVYRAVPSGPSLPSALGTVPCGQCPVYNACSNRGPVTPSSCQYYTDWLQP